MKRLLLLLALTAFVGGAAADEARAAHDRAKIHTELAAAYFSQAQLGVALEELNAALASDSSYAPAHNILGLVYMELREDDRAEESFRKALRLAPNDSEAANNYGWFLCQRNRVDESIRQFLAAIKNPLYGTPEKAYYNAGVCALKKNDTAAAEDFLQKALRVRPGMAPALYQLADVKFRRGDYAGAREALTTFMREVTNPPPESLWLALRAARKMGDRDAEASYGLALRKRYPDSKEALALKDARYE